MLSIAYRIRFLDTLTRHFVAIERVHTFPIPFAGAHSNIVQAARPCFLDDTQVSIKLKRVCAVALQCGYCLT